MEHLPPNLSSPPLPLPHILPEGIFTQFLQPFPFPDSTMLTISHLQKSYANGKQALRGVSLEIGQGVFGLLGPNGAGKTSLLEILAANLDFDGGDVLLDGKLSLRRRPQAWRGRLGYLPQYFDFPPNTTGREVLREAALLLDVPSRGLRERIDTLLERTNLTWAAGRAANEYSRGMKQRLGLALTLLHDPALILLDEPTAGLDPIERALFRELLLEIAPSHVVLLSTHIVKDVERSCDRLGVITDGEIRFLGSPAELSETARGFVWELDAAANEFDTIAAQMRVISSRREEDSRVRLRVLSPAPVSPWQMEPVEPTLEDGYFHLVEGARAQTEEARTG